MFFYCVFECILMFTLDCIPHSYQVEYLMLHSLWFSLCKVIVTPSVRSGLGSHSLSLLALLLNYRKNEVAIYTKFDKHHVIVSNDRTSKPVIPTYLL